jgi:DNA-binding PadR family transcriptional regulator
MAARGRHRPHDPYRAHGPAEDGQAPRSRGPNPIYELFVLGELMVQPMYGYQLHEVVNKALGPFHQLSWGTLYPLIRRLEQEGLATYQAEYKRDFFHRGTCSQAQARQVYSITEAGRQRFFALMLEPGEYCRAYPDLFAIKLTRFGFLTPEQRLLVLQHYRGYVGYLRNYWQSGQREVATIKDITNSERPFILQLFDYHLRTLDAEISWLDDQIARLSKEARQ